MKKQFVINPDIINNLSGDPASNQSNNYDEIPPQSDVPKQSVWSRIKFFFKKVAAVVAPILSAMTVVATTLNAISRFCGTSRRYSAKQGV